MFDISIHICTHNPRADYLRRTLEGLKAQTLPVDRWELLLVDNASTTETAKTANLTWHPNARYLLEPELGKTNALLMALRSSKAAIMVTVDDDNILAPDYLEKALEIGAKYPVLGAWGGQLFPEFEETPPEWTKPYWPMLAIRLFNNDCWSNIGERVDCVPVGAGMCTRHEVAMRYLLNVEKSPLARQLDRRGKGLDGLGGMGDTQLALTSLELGWGTGIFQQLMVTHLMPRERFTEDYIAGRIAGDAFSRNVYNAFNGSRLDISANSAIRRNLGVLKRRLMLGRRERRFIEAQIRGYVKAAEFWREVKNNAA
jgi:glycosyltransferase involved in cell wall biosynthesis